MADTTKPGADLTAAVITAVAESLTAADAFTDSGWRPVDRAKAKGGLTEWTEADLDAARDNSRHLCENNEYAIGGLEARRNYIVGTGFAYQVEPAAGVDVNHPTLPAVREFVDAFCELNDLPTVEAEALWRADRDGEFLLRLFPGDGIPEVRFVEPERVRVPDGRAADPDYRYGVQTQPRDSQAVLSYWVDPSTDPAKETPPEPVRADDVVHVGFNADSSFPRGIPTYYPVDMQLRDCVDLTRGMSATAKARAKIALLIKVAQLTTRTEDTLAKRLLEGSQTNARGERQDVSIERLPFGGIIRVGAGDEWTMPSANIGAGDTVQVLQARLRGVGVRLQMPEWMFTGLADQKYSNAFVVEAPTLKAFARIQATLVQAFGTGRLKNRASLVWRAIRMAVDGGLLPADSLRVARVTCTAPALEVRDRPAEAAMNQTYIGLGVKSVRTVQEEQGLDPEQEAKRGASAFTKVTGFKADGTPTTTPEPAPAGTPPANPQTAPPGSPAPPTAGTGGGSAILETVGGMTTLVAVQKDYAAGLLPREMALATATVVFNLQPAEADRLFPPITGPRPAPGATAPTAPPTPSA